MAFLEANSIGIDFPLYHANARSLKRTMVSAASGGRLGEDARKRVVVQALRDISFSLKPGDRLGLVGSNGAGKTTLLRVLAGIYEPVHGSVRASGTLNALLDPSMGMNSDLTGRENIALRGLYVGLSPAAISKLVDDVEDFADLGEFLDLPLRIYSSGMVVRIGFGLATAIRPQILLMDEWFLAGDFKFMAKARARMESLVEGAEILVLSSHSHDTVASWCNRVIWLEGGRVRGDGEAVQVLEDYLGQKLDAMPQKGMMFPE